MCRQNKPIKSAYKDEIGEHFWMCPECKTRVGGFTNAGAYIETKFCSECGIKLNWKLFWNDINRVCK